MPTIQSDAAYDRLKYYAERGHHVGAALSIISTYMTVSDDMVDFFLKTVTRGLPYIMNSMPIGGLTGPFFYFTLYAASGWMRLNHGNLLLTALFTDWVAYLSLPAYNGLPIWNYHIHILISPCRYTNIQPISILEEPVCMKSTHPKKIYLETTTRCNLHCRMCVKYATGSCIPEGHMPVAVFNHLLKSFSETEFLILNGIGEPLLHPHLVDFVSSARACMADGASIGFQSNGLLLDDNKAFRLLDAGLDTLCLSVDGLPDSEEDRDVKGEHCFSAVVKALSSLAKAKQKIGRNFRIGLETVLTRKNIHELPSLVAWAAAQGVDYIITTNLVLYSQVNREQSLFNPNSREAVQLFQKYQQKALLQGMNLDECILSYRKYAGTRSKKAAVDLLVGMQKEAQEKDIRLHLLSLLEHADTNDEIEDLLLTARRIAERHGIDLFIPPLQALDQRSCLFIEDEATFISPNGDVMPCHFLWHTYSCLVLQDDIQVQERIFGNVLEKSLETIWQSREYEAFRREAGRYEFSSCWSCSQGPCANLVNDAGIYANDCFGSQVPCGHCQWNLGGIRCL